MAFQDYLFRVVIFYFLNFSWEIEMASPSICCENISQLDFGAIGLLPVKLQASGRVFGTTSF